jgi:hypothetical protein
MSTTRHRRASGDDVPQANPHAEQISPEEFGRLVKDFYGTRTLLFDRQFAEAVLVYNTGNRRVTRRKLDVLSGVDSGRFVGGVTVLRNGPKALL